MLSEIDPFTLAIIVTALGITYRVYVGTKGKDISDIKIRPIIQTIFVAFTASIVLTVATFEAIPAGMSDTAFLPILIGQITGIIGADAAVRSVGKKLIKSPPNPV